MGWKKLTVIVVAAAAMVTGAITLSMHLTKQQELEMEVTDQTEQTVQPPKAGDTTTWQDIENMPIYYDDTDVLMLPVRNVVEGLGGSVKWDAEKKATEISFYGKRLVLNRGSREAELNGYAITLEHEVEAINGCLYVTADAFSDYFATEVIWDSEQRLVTVKTGDNTKPVIAGRVLEGKEGERTFSAEIPVIVGLNDISYEKRLNEDLEAFAMEHLISFADVIAAEDETFGAEAEQEAEEALEETAEEAAEAAAAEQTETAVQTEESENETQEMAQSAEPQPKQVRLGFWKGYCSTDFLSFYWEVDTDGVLSAQGVNIDLQEQKYVAISDLTTTEDIASQLHVFAERADLNNYYISQQKEWILLTNDAQSGTYQAVTVPQDLTGRIWKEKYLLFIA